MTSQAISIPTIGAAQPHLFVATAADYASTASLIAAQQQLMSSPTTMSSSSADSSSSYLVSGASPVSPSSSIEDMNISLGALNGAMSGSESPLDSAAAAAAALKKCKPHKCEVCAASFARKVHLQRHSLRHQVCKPYCCERCGKCFSRQDSLVRHHRLLHDSGRDVSVSRKSISSASASPKKQSTTSRKMSAVFTSPLTCSPSTASPLSPRCLRCSSVGVSCDGKQPCAPCAANNGGRACCYTGSAATMRNRERQDSAATSTASVLNSEDDEIDPNVWARRDTSSSVSSSMTADLASPIMHSFNGLGLDLTGHMHTQPFIYRANSFGMPFNAHPHEHYPTASPDMSYLHNSDAKLLQAGQMYDGSLLQAVALQTSLYPLLQNVMPVVAQQASFDYAAANSTAAHSSAMYAPAQQHDVAAQSIFDWTSMQSAAHGEMEKLPFTGTASDKSLSATLFSDDSPAIHSTLHSALIGGNTALPSYQHTPNDYSQLAMHIPQPPMHLTVPTTAAAENWDGLIRTLSSHTVNRSVGEAVVA